MRVELVYVVNAIHQEGSATLDGPIAVFNAKDRAMNWVLSGQNKKGAVEYEVLEFRLNDPLTRSLVVGGTAET